MEVSPRFPRTLAAIDERRHLIAACAGAIAAAAEREGREFSELETEILDAAERELAMLDARAARFRTVVWPRPNGAGNGNGAHPASHHNGGAP